MQFFKKKAKSKGRVGLNVNSERLAFVHMEVRDDIPHLLSCERIPLESEKEAGKALNKLVKDLGLEGTQCSYVLNPKDYNLHLVEAPNVEPEELKQAVRWKIKDLLDMKVEDAAINVFQVPEDAYRGREMVYVVAALKTRIQNIVKLISESGLELAVIDIPELVMKNIASRFIDDDGKGELGETFIELPSIGSSDVTISIFEGRTQQISGVDVDIDDIQDDRPFFASAPDPDNVGDINGSAIIEFDLSDAELPFSLDFLSYDWRGAANLENENEDGDYGDNPRGRITFGSYHGHDRVINWQEI